MANLIPTLFLRHNNITLYWVTIPVAVSSVGATPGIHRGITEIFPFTPIIVDHA